MAKNDFLEKATKAIDESKILYIAPGVLTLGGEDFTNEDAKDLSSEAKMILSSRLWDSLYNTLLKTAQTYMFTGLKTIEDSYYGKALLFSLDVQKRLLERIATLSPSPEVDKKK